MLLLLFFNMELKETFEGVQSFWSFSRIYLQEKPRASDPYLESILKGNPERLRSLSSIYLEEKPREPRILISNVYRRGTWRASDPDLGYRIYLEEEPRESQILISDLY